MMKRIIALWVVLLVAALLATHVASASPSYKRSPSINTNVVMTYTFPITETGVDSLAFEVNGLCSVVYESAGSDDASLYAVPTGGTATTSGTLIVAYTDSSTVPTVFQPGTRWVRAVAVSAVTGDSVMRITCSNTQMASTGEACGTSGLVPYVGTGGRYKCEPAFSYDDVDNELNAGVLVLDPIAGKNVVRFPGISAFTGPNPAAGEVLVYALTDAVEPGLAVETLDSLDAPSRLVIRSPDYYDVVLSWGVEFSDVDNEYITLAPGPGTPVVRKFCMVKSAGAFKEETYTTADVSTTITIPLAGSNGCTATAGAAKQVQAYGLMGDPFIADAWCYTRTNIVTGGDAWDVGDEVVVRFGVSNVADIEPDEFLTSAHDMTYGHDEIVVAKGNVSRFAELREVVDAYSSSFFAGSLSPGAVDMVLYTASIEGMTRASGSTWNVMQLTCSLGIQFKDTR